MTETLTQKIERILRDLEAYHTATGREVTIYSEAKLMIEQMRAAIHVTLESREVLSAELEKTKAQKPLVKPSTFDRGKQ